jgi:pyruvate formate lyase activating enzyme
MIKECVLYKKKKNEMVQCFGCAHKCLIDKGNFGTCKVRKNMEGKLMLMVYGKIASLGVDPIEKKPLYHFYPGSCAFSIGTVGCNFKCEWCQNWDITQASKVKTNSEASTSENHRIFGEEISPKEVVDEALKTGCRSIAYTYNEPAVFIEFVKDCAVLAQKQGLKNILVTNGYFSKESFDYIKDYIDAANIDLKSFNEDTYSKYCGADLEVVLDNIKRFHKKGIWIEITTLLIPGINDTSLELEKIAKFISSVDKNIPWHISRFFPKYKMTGKPVTHIEDLERAYKIGKKYLNDVHIGNV